MTIKIKASDITYGSTDPEEVEAFLIAGKLSKMGYRRISNAYCCVARIDRDDWLDVLATKMHCCVADFYNKDGTGVKDEWKDHYIRCYSTDKQTVHFRVYKMMQKY